MSAEQKLSDYVEKLAAQKVLVVGDIVLDRFVYGAVHRLSPEAPVPVLLKDRQEDVLGGAGNVLSNLYDLKVTCFVLGIVGDDEAAEVLKGLLRSRAIDDSGLLVDPSRPTIIKNRFLDQNKHLLRVDTEVSGDISSQLQDQIFAKAAALLEDIDAVILSDYGKGILTTELTRRLITLANEHNVPVLVDPKGHDYTKYKGATLATPNTKELSEATGGMQIVSDEQVIAAARALLRSSGLVSLVATRSEKGMSVFQSGDDRSDPVHIRTVAQEVFDVTGAGDTVIATLAASIAAGASLVEAAHLSNLAAGLVVSRTGTVTADFEALKEAVISFDYDNAKETIPTDKELLA